MAKSSPTPAQQAAWDREQARREVEAKALGLSRTLGFRERRAELWHMVRSQADQATTLVALAQLRAAPAATTTKLEHAPPWQAEGLTIEERLEELCKAHPECVGLSSRKLADEIGKSHTAVRKTDWYKNRAEARELAKRHIKALSEGEYLDQFGDRD